MASCFLPFLLHLAGVDDVDHVVDGDRGLGDVGGDDDLGDVLRRPVEHGLLLLVGEGRVKRVHHTPDTHTQTRKTLNASIQVTKAKR